MWDGIIVDEVSLGGSDGLTERNSKQECPLSKPNCESTGIEAEDLKVMNLGGYKSVLGKVLCLELTELGLNPDSPFVLAHAI